MVNHIIDTLTNEIVIHESVRKAAVQLGTKHNTIKNYLKTINYTKLLKTLHSSLFGSGKNI